MPINQITELNKFLETCKIPTVNTPVSEEIESVTLPHHCRSSGPDNSGVNSIKHLKINTNVSCNSKPGLACPDSQATPGLSLQEGLLSLPLGSLHCSLLGWPDSLSTWGGSGGRSAEAKLLHPLDVSPSPGLTEEEERWLLKWPVIGSGPCENLTTPGNTFQDQALVGSHHPLWSNLIHTFIQVTLRA